MKPLAAHGGAAADLIWACAAAWSVFELVLAIRAGRGGGRDRSFIPLTVSVVGGLALGLAASRGVQSLALPGPGWWPIAVGVPVFALGLGLRAWAFHVLGRFFKFTVVVQPGHEVVDTGPYRVIRHPSYTGLLTAELGLGIALGTWLSLPACVLPPLIAFSVRLLTEEQVLARELGAPYRAYMASTKRLIPGIW
ncbi:MAG: methyltransferase family protein [Solirubrobacterales bacterium]